MSWYKTAQELTNPLDGRSNPSARNYVNKLVHPYTKGIFSDQDWSNVKRVWDALDSAGLNWVMRGSQYYKDEEQRPSSKEWKFEVYFTNKNGRPTTLHGTLTAHGAGSVEDPLDRYDITCVVY
jgi:hypothetical protein